MRRWSLQGLPQQVNMFPRESHSRFKGSWEDDFPVKICSFPGRYLLIKSRLFLFHIKMHSQLLYYCEGLPSVFVGTLWCTGLEASGLFIRSIVGHRMIAFALATPNKPLPEATPLNSRQAEGIFRPFFLVHFGAKNLSNLSFGQLVDPSAVMAKIQATPGWPAMDVQRVGCWKDSSFWIKKWDNKKIKYTLLWYVTAKHIVFLDIYLIISIEHIINKSLTYTRIQREREFLSN